MKNKKGYLTVFHLAIVLYFLLSANCTFSQDKALPVDLKLFFKNGEKDNFQISPDGKYYSYIADYKGMLNIFVKKINDTNAIRVTEDTLRSIWNYGWKGDRIVYVQDIGGDENYQLFSVTATGTDLKALTPFPGCRTEMIDPLFSIPGKEKENLIAINKRDKQYFDLYFINIETGQLTLAYENTQNFSGWVTDNNGVIRIASKTDGANFTYMYRETEKDTFHVILTTSVSERFVQQAFDADNKYIYVLSSLGRDKVALIEYDPVAKKEVKELFTQSDYDLAGFSYDKKRKILTGVWWQGEKSDGYNFDKQWDSIFTQLQKKFKGYNIYFASLDDERKNGILVVSSDKLRRKYYVYNFISEGLIEIADPYPWLDEKNMAEMRPITYKSRDGLTIHGYLTLPKGVEAKNLPVVVNPHGGPWARDGWGYNPEVQFLANRGYAVLQINFRGSTGYGNKFFLASRKEWGKKMQDDITDGVEYIKKEGIADPKRIAIYGISYGGYATLAGITFTPDIYVCAVDYCGVTNLLTFMNTFPSWYAPYLDLWYDLVGNPEKDSLLLADASPVLHANQIKAPLFIAQGANDPRVNKSESDQMVAALKNRGVKVEYMVKDNEGHGFLNQDNLFDFYGAMEKFLANYLKP